MLAGYSSRLVSPRHRLKSEAPAHFEACNFPSMSTHRLDLPCSFARKDTPRTQSIRHVGLPVEKHTESKTNSCSLKQNICLQPSVTTAPTAFVECKRESIDEYWERRRSLKRFSEQVLFDDDDEEACMYRAKRKKGDGKSDDSVEEERKLILSQLGWMQQGFDVPLSLPFLTGLDPPQLPFSLSCSGEEDQVFFVPSEVIRPPLPFTNNPWANSVVTEITEFDEKDVETSQCPVNEASGSSDSSDSHGSSQRKNGTPQEQEIGNGSRPPNPTVVADVVGQNESDTHGERDGFEMINLLVACVEAIGSKNVASVNQLIAILGNLASPKGSAISRLTAYFTEALALRVARLWPQIFHISPPQVLDLVDNDCSNALRLLNQVSPIPRFIHFTANENMLRAFEGKERVHIIDFDIKQGLQWPSLFQSLASRSNPPSHVRITGIGDSKQELIETGERLAGFAATLNLPFEFHPVVDKLEDVRLWMLHVKEKESVAVNCAFQLQKLLYDSTGGALRNFLELIHSTNPVTVVIAEQEAEHNEDSLEARLANSLKYYSALFDALDESVPQDNPIRMKIEAMYAREIKDIIACEGPDRFERHQGFGKWRRMIEQGGFRGLEISERELLQSQMLLKMYGGSKKFKVEKQDAAALTLSWSDQPLYTVSVWKAFDIAGSSSSFTPRFH